MSATRLHVLATPPVAAGFALSGLETTAATSPEQGRARARALAADPTVAVLLIEDAALRGLSDAERAVLLRREQPMIVPFESPRWIAEPERAAEPIFEILRRAIGYRVRLQ